MANNPNFHGFRIEQDNLAKVKLGKRKYDQFKAGCTMERSGQGDQIPPQAQNNLPLKTANNHNWSDDVR